MLWSVSLLDLSAACSGSALQALQKLVTGVLWLMCWQDAWLHDTYMQPALHTRQCSVVRSVGVQRAKRLRAAAQDAQSSTAMSKTQGKVRGQEASGSLEDCQLGIGYSVALCVQPIDCLAAIAWEAKKPLDVTTVTVGPPQKGEVRIKVCTCLPSLPGKPCICHTATVCVFCTVHEPLSCSCTRCAVAERQLRADCGHSALPYGLIHA